MYRPACVVLLFASALRAEEPARRLPAWLDLGGEIRGRFEANTATEYRPENNDYYYLHRVRLRAGVKAGSHVRFFGEVRQTSAPGRNEPVPPTATDRVDIQQAYTEFSTGKETRWGARVGRQEFNFGAQRLIGASNWGNTGRNFDSIRLFRETKDLRIDVLAAMVTEVVRPDVDPFRPEVQLQAVYVTSKSWIPKGLIETYVFRKIANREVTLLPSAGRTDHYSIGTRAVGKLPRSFDYNLETVLQTGTLGGRSHHAWAGYWVIGYTIGKSARAPRLGANYSYASGTKDGSANSGTFDQLYPTNHAFYGIADRISWRNIHEAMASVDWRPKPKILTQFQYHSFWLATRADAFYNFNGRPFVRNPKASSAHLDQEFDVNVVWDISKHVQSVIGYAHIFAGQYIRESTPGSNATMLFTQWRYSF